MSHAPQDHEIAAVMLHVFYRLTLVLWAFNILMYAIGVF